MAEHAEPARAKAGVAAPARGAEARPDTGLRAEPLHRRAEAALAGPVQFLARRAARAAAAMPSPSQMIQRMDNGDEIMINAEEVNPAGLQDNCFVCVAAYFRGVTVNDLVVELEEMQVGPAAAINDVAAYFAAVGIAHQRMEYAGLDAAEAGMIANGWREVALAYLKANGSGHVIVAIPRADATIDYYDPQSRAAMSRDTLAAEAPGGQFFAFPQR